ncbi:hypothetical protein DBV15_05785, partial [Temnothorax longispinosus]
AGPAGRRRRVARFRGATSSSSERRRPGRLASLASFRSFVSADKRQATGTRGRGTRWTALTRTRGEGDYGRAVWRGAARAAAQRGRGPELPRVSGTDICGLGVGNSRGARCRRRFSHLGSPWFSVSSGGRLLLASSGTNTHARHGGETRARPPETGNARGEARHAEGRDAGGRWRDGRRHRSPGGGGDPHRARAACRATPRLGSCPPPLLTSHLATGAHKQIPNNGYASSVPSSPTLPTAATGSPTRPGRGTVALGRDGCQVAREFHGKRRRRGLRVLAVYRKYDNCHGGPSPTPQELTRAGHYRGAGRAGPIGRPAFARRGGLGGLDDVEKLIMRPVLRRNVARLFEFLRGNAHAGPPLVPPWLRAQSAIARANCALPVAGIPRVLRKRVKSRWFVKLVSHHGLGLRLHRNLINRNKEN